MPKSPSFKPKDIEKILLGQGFYIKRQTGSHRIYHHALLESVVVVPFHSRDIPPGTLHSIIKQSKLEAKKFRK